MTLPHLGHIGGKRGFDTACICQKILHESRRAVASAQAQHDVHHQDLTVARGTRADADGLALSSRNQYLSAAERAVAPELHRGLIALRLGWQQGRAVTVLEAEAVARLQSLGFVPDYVQIRRGVDLQHPASGERDGLVALVAARLGRTRLIDNLELAF